MPIAVSGFWALTDNVSMSSVLIAHHSGRFGMRSGTVVAYLHDGKGVFVAPIFMVAAWRKTSPNTHNAGNLGVQSAPLLRVSINTV